MQKKLLTECVLDPRSAWIDTLRTAKPEVNVATFSIAAPFHPTTLGRHSLRTQPDAFFHAFNRLRASPHRRAAERPWEWRVSEGIIPASDLFGRVRTQLAAMAPIARAGLEGTREIAFMLPLVSFGGVEQVGMQVAARFKAAGWRTRLVVTEVNEVMAPERLYDVFDTILFLNDPSYASWVPSELKYFGHELQSWPVQGRHDRLIGLLTGCAAVMMLHANHGYEVMGWLRRQGSVTINSLHLLDRDLFNVPVGHPYVSLAYEHAFDLICAPGHKLLSFCAAAGVPQEKLLYLGNAPSFAVDDEVLTRRLQELDELAQPGARRRKLRVLSIGRLDRQKGGERLAALMARTQALELPVEWRVVGGRVVADARAAETGLTVEPPVFDRAGMIERLLWADVVVLLSRWEGSPLLILEAQSLGVVPIATDTGAVSEMIETGVNGFLVPNSGGADVVAHALTALEQLVESPALRAEMGRQALERMREVTWPNTAAALVEKVEALVVAAEKKLVDAPAAAA